MSSMLARALRRWFGWFPKKSSRGVVNGGSKYGVLPSQNQGAAGRYVDVEHRFYGRIRVLADDSFVSAHVLDGETIWERHLVDLFAKHFRPGWNAVDVGANLGFHTLALAKQASLGETIFAFEPHPEIFPIVKANCESHANVRLFQLAASDSRREVRMLSLAETKNQAGIAVNEAEGNGGHVVETTTIDALQLPRVGLMKIDVEGHELACLRGAEETIRRDKPVLIVEIMGGHDIRTAAPEIVEEIERRIAYICSLGYRATHIDSHDYLFLRE